MTRRMVVCLLMIAEFAQYHFYQAFCEQNLSLWYAQAEECDLFILRTLCTELHPLLQTDTKYPQPLLQDMV
jgi:hypothetical protein